jgi:hypothetical protein
MLVDRFQERGSAHCLSVYFAYTAGVSETASDCKFQHDFLHLDCLIFERHVIETLLLGIESVIFTVIRLPLSLVNSSLSNFIKEGGQAKDIYE